MSMSISGRSLLAFLLCAFSPAASLAQASTPPSQALLEDATSYAADSGVTLEEAVRRLRLQSEIGALEETLSVQEAESFAGLWIEHQPKYRVVVRFKEASAEGRLRARLTGTILEGMVETRPAAASLAQLEERRAVAVRHARGARFAVDSDINVQENRVEIYSDRPQALRSALTASRATLPERVEIVTVPRLAEPAVLRGGDGDPGYCTGGFTVTAFGGRGISTAGHCEPVQYFQGLALPFMHEYFWRSADVQWHQACGYIDVSNEFNSGFGNRACTGMRTRSQQAIGTYVCKWGNVTGRTCGYIQSKTYSLSFVPDSYNTFIRVNGYGANLVSPGDSGGPWFVENLAYGTSSARMSDGDAIYMPIDYFSWLGLTLLTYDPGPGCPPVAKFTYTASTTTSLNFNASWSYDPDGSIVSYFWDFGDSTTGSGSVVNHIYPYEGTYPVSLVVTDNSGKATTYTENVNACGGDPCCGDPCCGDPCCGDPFCIGY